VGTATCTHDAAPVPNCKSPLTIQANTITSADTKHNFTVTFTDVCGRVKTAHFSYTQKGIVPETKVDSVGGASAVAGVARPGAAGSNNGASTNGHSNVGPRAIVSLVMGVLCLLALLV
jgi:hypothetical protein